MVIQKLNTQQLIILLAGWFILISNISSAQSLRLDSCQAMAVRNYPLIKQYDLIAESTEYNLSNASKAYLPQFDVTLIGGVIDGLPSFGQAPESGSSTEFNLISVLQLNQTIWDGGMTKQSKAITRAGSEVEMADVDVQMHALKSRVNSVFFAILLIDEQINLLNLLEDNLKENQLRVKAAYQGGVAYQSDLDEIEVEILNTSQKLSELTYSRKAYLNMLSLLIGQELTDGQQLDEPETYVALNADILRPELRLFENQRKMLEALDKLDKAVLNPKIGVLGFGTFLTPGVEFGSDDLNNILVGGVSVSWKVGDLYKRNNNKSLNDLELQKINVMEETFLFSTNLELSKTNQELAKYNQLLQEDEKIIEIKSRLVKSYQSKYDNGVATMRDLLNRINDENMARQNMALHEIQRLKAQYEMKTITGN